MLKLAMIFTDKMVLQRNKPIPIWGNAQAGEKVSVTLTGKSNDEILSAAAIANEHGTWKVELPAHEAGTDFTMEVAAGEDKILLQDICIGEVWLAGGQSNMEYLLGFEQHFEEVVKTERNPWIRFFDYPEVSYEGALEDFNCENEGFWRGCTEEDLGYFTAVGYYFAKNLQENLDIPVGIVGCNWGGTTACSWMDPERLKGTEGEVWIEDYEKELAKIKDLEAYKEAFKKNPMNDRTHRLADPMERKLVAVGIDREEQLAMMEEMEKGMASAPDFGQIGPYYERRPGGLYEVMLKKIVPYGIRGVIWYQGESDGDGHGEAYGTVFTKLIENWRDLWQDELPFLFVQLAPFYKWLMCEGSVYHSVRNCQEQVAKTVSNTWMAAIGDCGMEWDIHPKNKQPVGERLALLARGHVYGEDLLCDAPEFLSVRKEGNDLVLSFLHNKGLHIEGALLNAMMLLDEEGNPLSCVKTFGETGNLVAVEASVENEELILKNCGNAKEIQFGCTDYYEVNLYNEAHIPVKPFKTVMEV